MYIYIPTYKRVDKQPTLACIPEALRPKTRLVVDASEEGIYKEKYGNGLVVATPGGIKGISATRQWILENSLGKYAMMIDDDQSFAVRKDGKLPKYAEEDIVGMHSLLTSWLEEGLIHV